VSGLKITPIAGKPIQHIVSAVNQLHRCGHTHGMDVPDIPARQYIDNKGVTHMVVGATQYHVTTGTDMFKLNRSCAIAFNETGDSDPAMFAGDEFLDSTHSFGNGTVISLVHTEYPGNVYDNCTTTAEYPTCWTVTLGLAVSHDWGMTWKHARPPPHHLVAAVPYGYNQSQMAYGWGDPSNIVKSPKDDFYYVAFWNRNQVGLQPPGICIARTKELLDPSSWRGYDGATYTRTFVSPYTMAPGTEAEHVCVVADLPAPGCAAMGLVWSTYLEKFVVTMECGEAMGGAIQYATSDDLIAWSAATPLYNENDLPANIRKNVTSMHYPTFMDPTAPKAFNDDNFFTIGAEPYLYWVSIGHSPYTDGRSLWATQMKFQKD